MDQIEDVSSLRQRLALRESAKADCQRLAAFAPTDIQEQVSTILSSGSQYLDYGALRKQLEDGDWSKGLNAADCLQKEQLLRDVQQGKALRQFLNDFESRGVDVLSLAEISTIISGTKSRANGPGLTIEQRLEVQAVLRTIEE